MTNTATTEGKNMGRYDKKQRGAIGRFVACAVLSVTACSSSDDDGGADDDATADDGAASSEPATSTMPSTNQVEAATAFWEALAAQDRDTALSLLDPALLESGAGNPFGRAQTLELPVQESG
jgi:hypothetical protein